mgnify:FL=1
MTRKDGKMTQYIDLTEFIQEVDELLRADAHIEAKEKLENILLEEPGFGAAHGYLGWLYAYVFNDANKAELHFEYALDFDPSHVAAYINYVGVLISQRRADKVIEVLTAYIELENADLEWAFESLGRAYEMKCSYRLATTHYKKAQHLVVDTIKSEGISKDLSRVRKKRWKAFWTSE